VSRDEGRRRGPRRTAGAPSGRDEVRRAVLDAAARLFAARGVDHVSLREVATAANVQLALIHRYVGSRDELVRETFDHLGRQLAQDVLERPLEGHGFDADSTMGRWTRIASYLAISGVPPSDAPPFNPVVALAETIQEAYGLDATAARIRGAQIAASALGWRLFEEYLIAAGDLDDLPVDVLRADLTAGHRRLGATPWPSPPDPPRRTD
jgi:TetR/AcrR family transcriptional regulator, repressor for neighboring sulfatase